VSSFLTARQQTIGDLVPQLIKVFNLCVNKKR